MTPMAWWPAASAIAGLAEQVACGREASDVFVAATDRGGLHSDSGLLQVPVLP
jgi:hypothetical protein